MVFLCVFLYFRWLSRVSLMTDNSSHCRQVTSKVIVAFWWLWAAVGAYSLSFCDTTCWFIPVLQLSLSPCSVSANPSSTIDRFACFITSICIEPSAPFFPRWYQCTKRIALLLYIDGVFFTSNGLNMDRLSQRFCTGIGRKVGLRILHSVREFHGGKITVM